ncbi:hypothetical protein PIB30_074568 [Stylosanthes scabra]|uniref:Uncharacterized protein n=1 Tax=Stylosanthes scabra TaxID=79078 RepID=A0ABU6XMM4_9FABA|nr:hypothetical protein [Stylosanthes scabra]
MLAREIQEIRKGQINQTLENNQRAEAEKNLQLSVERQARDISEMRKSQTNAERGRPMFYGALKSDVGASTSSESSQQEPLPLRTAPPLPDYQPPRPPLN